MIKRTKANSLPFKQKTAIITLVTSIMLTGLFCLNSFAVSYTDAVTYLLNDFTGTYVWQSNDFNGSISREWDERTSYFKMNWDTVEGDTLLMLGKGRGSLPVWFNNIPKSTMISFSGESSSEIPGEYFYGVYGWTGDNTRSYKNEWYIQFQGKEPSSNCESIGSIEVDGVIYDCYKQWMYWSNKPDWQYRAHIREKTWSPAVRIQPILQYFVDLGMSRCVVDLKVAIEGFKGSRGKVSLKYLDIPILSQRVINRSFEIDKGFSQAPQGWSTWSKSNDLDADFITDSDSHFGTSSLMHSKNGAYSVRTYQSVSVPNGTYNLRVFAKASSGGTRTISVRNYGGDDRYQIIKPDTEVFSEHLIEGIKVTNGNAEVWLGTDASEDGVWTKWDSVDLVRVDIPAVSTSVLSSKWVDNQYKISALTVNNTKSTKDTKLIFALYSADNKLLSIGINDLSINAGTFATSEGSLFADKNGVKIKIFSFDALGLVLPNSDTTELMLSLN